MADYITLEQYGKTGFTRDKEHPDAKSLKNAKKGLLKARTAMLSGKYDIVVLDEINTAHFFKLITVEEMLELVKTKPDGVELIFTGICATRIDCCGRPGDGDGRSQTLLR